jgi:hypothetical protein
LEIAKSAHGQYVDEMIRRVKEPAKRDQNRDIKEPRARSSRRSDSRCIEILRGYKGKRKAQRKENEIRYSKPVFGIRNIY